MDSGNMFAVVVNGNIPVVIAVIGTIITIGLFSVSKLFINGKENIVKSK